MKPTAPLIFALQDLESVCGDAIDKLREIASPETHEQVYELTARFRESVALMGVLRRAVPLLSRAELHQVFGAPGDFGYETPLGAALAKVYSAPRETAPEQTLLDKAVAALDGLDAKARELVRIGETSPRFGLGYEHELLGTRGIVHRAREPLPGAVDGLPCLLVWRFTDLGDACHWLLRPGDCVTCLDNLACGGGLCVGHQRLKDISP